MRTKTLAKLKTVYNERSTIFEWENYITSTSFMFLEYLRSPFETYLSLTAVISYSMNGLLTSYRLLCHL